jgi:hypothetical protein
MKIRFILGGAGAELFHTDGRTDRQTKLIVALRKFLRVKKMSGRAKIVVLRSPFHITIHVAFQTQPTAVNSYVLLTNS